MPASTATPSSKAVADGNQRAVARLRAVTTVSLVLPVLLFLVIAALLYRQQFRDAEQRIEGNAHILEEQALKLFETNEILLQRMLDLTDGLTDEQLLARSESLHLRLRTMAAPLTQVQILLINGADARPLADSRVHPPPHQIDLSDRDWYRAHRSGTPGVFISDLHVGRMTGEFVIDVSRRRSLPDGSFGGSVHASLRPEYFIGFYKGLASTMPGLRMALLRNDGQYLARWPEKLQPGLGMPAGGPLMQIIASGADEAYVEHKSPLDGVARLVSVHKVPGYPLYVAAAMDRADLITAWLRQIGLLALFLVPSSLAFAAMAWSALQRTRRQFEALRRLEDEVAMRHRIETSLLMAQKLEAMGRLTGGVAHDFNNLLMVLNTSLYLHKKLNPQLADNKQLALIEHAIASGTQLTRQLLAFSRKQALRPERTDLAARLPELLVMIKPVVGAAVEVDCEVAPDTGAIDVDAAELELALINLAVNARDAMQGAGRLTIRARNPADDERPPNVDGELVMIEVIDSGSGIDPERAAKLFEPFFTTKPLGKGTGLGLSQVQTLCQSADGVATIDNAPGSGARVRLYFARSAAPPALDVHVPPLTPALAGRVLLVEDNDAVADATAELLRTIGCSVERVANAQAALDRVDSTDGARIDVVLSDIEMPGGLDGVSLANRLSQRHPPLPVVLMTGFATRLEQAQREGLDVLPKPCSPEVLAAAIGRAQRPKEPVEAV